MASVKLFVKQGCNRCPSAKAVTGALILEGYKVVEYDIDTAEGLAEGAYYGVMSTPTVLVVDGEENPITCWRGVVPVHEEVRDTLRMLAPSK
jgi:hypothetical protein